MNNSLLVLLAGALLFSGAMLFNQQPAGPASLRSAQHVGESLIIDQFIAEEFIAWKVEHGRKYGSLSYEEYRMTVFKTNYEMILAHNNIGDSYTMAPNDFMDMTSEEFAAIYLSLQVPEKAHNVQIEHEEEDFVPAAVPNAIDWKASGHVTPVKNQGSCGSCWAFSATATIESQYKVSGKQANPDLSEQQLNDCSWPQGNMGCNGGWPTSAFQYVQAHGITNTSNYKYTARDGTCAVNGGDNKIGGYKEIPYGNCNALTTALASQPISVCVDASNWSFYKDGVLKNCGTNINHAVLLTGQDNAGNWNIKNSWGTGWGTSGYITLAPGNTCGVCYYAAYTN